MTRGRCDSLLLSSYELPSSLLSTGFDRRTTDERFASKGTTVINRYPIEKGVATIGLHPGSHKFTISADGFTPQSWEFEAAPASSHSHEFELEPIEKPSNAPALAKTVPIASPTQDLATPPSTKNGTTAMVYVGAIASGVFAAGAVGMGLLTNARKSDFEAANDGTRYARAADLRSEVKTYALVTDLCIGGAVLSAGATAYLYFAGRSNDSRPRAGWRVAPTVGSSNAGVALVGEF